MSDPPPPSLVNPNLHYRRVVVHDRGYLPHWQLDSATYFVTFRVADSLPAHVKDASIRGIEKELDSCHGSCPLRDSRLAQIVEDAIQFLDGKRYRLLAWCVMPNHVHLVFKLLPGQKIEEVMHSLKSFTAHQANQMLGQTGAFWQREYFDRILRNQDQLVRAVDYVLDNPAKAGLADWPWVGIAVL